MGLVVAKHFSSLQDAQIACEMLRAQGIGAMVLDQHNTALMGVGANGLAPSFRVWAPQEELIDAQRLLGDLDLAEGVEPTADEDYDDSFDWTQIDDEPSGEARLKSEFSVESRPLARVIAGVIFALLAGGMIAAALLTNRGGP